MRVILQFIFVSSILFVFFSSFSGTGYAQTTPNPLGQTTSPNGSGQNTTPQTPAQNPAGQTTPSPTAAPTSPCGNGIPLTSADLALAQDTQGDSDFTTNPNFLSIDESLPCVDITFHNLNPGTKYFICTGDDNCFGTGKISDDSVLTDDGSQADEEGDVRFRVCGDGDNLKIEGCGPDKENWFQGGQMYNFSVVKKAAQGDKYQPVKNGGFYVTKYYPTVSVEPNQSLVAPINTFKVTISGRSKGGGEKRNNYQVLVQGGEGGYDSEGCIDIGQAQPFGGITDAGVYTILIKEQINEPDTLGGALKSGDTGGGGGGGGGLLGFDPNPLHVVKKVTGVIGDLAHDFTHPKDFAVDIAKQALRPIIYPIQKAIDVGKFGVRTINDIDNTFINTCQGGFTYYQITCGVSPANKAGGSCTNPQDGKDPQGEEYKAFLKELAALNKKDLAVGLPCGNGSNPIRTKNSTLNCKSINTAIGNIDVSSFKGFIETMFGFILTLAGFGAIIIIIYSGYLLMISRGDKEKLAGARETITAAIVGLLFIILSIVILEIVGVDILKIPGLSR